MSESDSGLAIRSLKSPADTEHLESKHSSTVPKLHLCGSRSGDFFYPKDPYSSPFIMYVKFLLKRILYNEVYIMYRR